MLVTQLESQNVNTQIMENLALDKTSRWQSKGVFTLMSWTWQNGFSAVRVCPGRTNRSLTILVRDPEP